MLTLVYILSFFILLYYKDMKKILSVLATAVLVLQSLGTSLVYAQADAIEWNEGWEPVAAVDTVVDESTPDADNGDEVSAWEEAVTEEEVAEPENLEEAAPAEETAEEPEAPAVDEEPADEAPAGNAEEETAEPTEQPAEVVELDDELEDPVAESKAEEVAQAEEEKSALATLVEETIVKDPLRGYVDWILVIVQDPYGELDWARMELTPVLEEHVFDLIDSSLDAKVTKVVAVDITFYDEEWNKVEPSKPINVTMMASDMPEPQAVVHVETDYNDEKIEVWEAEVEEIDSKIIGEVAKFEAESFSIYAIVVTEDKWLLVNFNKNGEVITWIYIKDSSENINNVIFDPGVGDVWANEVFKWWTLEEEYTTSSKVYTIAQVREYISEHFNELWTGVDFHAKVLNRYTVKYLDDKWIVNFTEDKLYTNSECENENIEEAWCEISYTINHTIVAEDDQHNLMWRYVGSPSWVFKENWNKIKLTWDLVLRADIEEGHRLVFNENGKHATYNAPQFVLNWDAPKEEYLAMSRPGYEFWWWYTNEGCEGEECIDEFNFSKVLTDKTFIYAKWTPVSTAEYTVLIWKQNLAWDGYDFEEAINLPGNVNNTITTVTQQGVGNNAYARINWTNKQYTWFHLERFDNNVTVKPEGNSIVNVYYNRNEYTLSFEIDGYVYTETTSDEGQQYGVRNWNYIEIYYNDGTWYRTRNRSWGSYTYSNPYTWLRYIRWHAVKTITALYEQPIWENFPIVGINGVTYNNWERWNPQQPNTVGFTEVMVYLDIMPAWDVTFKLDTKDRPLKTINWYVEALPEDLDTISAPNKLYNFENSQVNTPADIKFTLYNSISARYNGVTKEDFIDIVWFDRLWSDQERKRRGNNNTEFYIYDENNDWTINFYYTRETYPLNFMDWRYVDGNNNPLDEDNQWKLDNPIDGIPYGADLTSYNEGWDDYFVPDAPTWFVFAWWFIDEWCTTPYTFTTMPQWGITVYAKWILKEYRVFLHPNVPADENINRGSDSVKMNFRVNYWNETISTPTWKDRLGYEFVGWYKDEALSPNQLFSSYETLNDANTIEYDKTTHFTDPMDNWWNGAETNADVDRFWITREFNLYAKWRKVIDWADGIYVQYVVWNEDPIVDKSHIYTDWAMASVFPAPKSPKGQQFQYWLIQKYENGEFVGTDEKVYPWDSFEVKLAYASGKEITCETEGDTGCMEYVMQLKAVFEDIVWPDTTSITYCPNYDDTVCEEVKDIPVNTEYTLKEWLTREWYTFLWWSTDPGRLDGNDWTWFGGWATVWANNVNLPNTLYAIWEVAQYTVTFKSEDGATTLWTSTVVYGWTASDAGIDKTKADSADGHYSYTFANWYTETTEWEVDDLSNVTADRTVYARFTEQCAPGYHDLRDEPSSQDGTAGNSTVTPADGWRLDTNATSETLICVPNKQTVSCTRWSDKIGTYEPADVEIEWNGQTWSEPAACALSCPSGYHLNANKDACEKNPWWGGGWGSSGGGQPDDDEEIELGWQVSDKCSISGTNLSAEEIEAYLYACENDITTIRDINEARLGDYLNRAEMAKIISVFATKELWMKPNTSKDCSNFAASMEWWSQEMKDYMVMSCQLELMWIHTVNYEPIPDFMPAKRVSRAEFGTILSRVLWWDTYEGTNENYYFRHLDALKANGIITNIDPNITEYRAWVFLMIYRSVEKIKASIGDTSKSVEEEVNEELKEEWNEWTWTTIWMPNPASVYCEQQGWTVDLESSKCKLADGTEVDEWEYYRANNKEEESDTETTTD